MLRTVRPSANVARLGLRMSQRHVSQAISAPTLMNLEVRWEGMSQEERDDIVAQLAERQKGSWKDLTVAEKRAAWYISYGPWGPRRPIHAPGSGKKIALGIVGIIIAAAGVFGFARLVSAGMPHTMSKEWQEASNEILKENKANPFSGYDQVQSPSRGLPEQAEDDDE
ncbi:cytochrome c oxidase subunit 5A, mitochondrial [Trichomonascus vanleenenianus]|uniref:cytochrome c oxidase subunit IV family protein n=1 Tax=Trichomonascus vanleenenianus TaxID=2268995 RepID=UPI003EC97D9B